MGIDGKKYAEAIAAELRAERAAKTPRLTVEALGERAGLHKQTLLRYLNGTRDIPMPVFYDLAQALGVNPIELVERAERRLASEEG